MLILVNSVLGIVLGGVFTYEYARWRDRSRVQPAARPAPSPPLTRTRAQWRTRPSRAPRSRSRLDRPPTVSKPDYLSMAARGAAVAGAVVALITTVVEVLAR